MAEGAANGGAFGGHGVDARGHPVSDPTQNVLDLVAAAIARMDDLRTQEQVHIRELTDLREDYGEKLRVAEYARINALRAVDVGAVNRAAEVAGTQQLTLATQVATSAETLRAQVEATRVTTAAALAAALEPIQESISDLRRVQYEQAGQKVGTAEHRITANDSRTIIFSILGVLATTAVIISPHIH